MEKSPEAFRTISEVADWLGVPTHVLRFWESRFSQVKPVKRAGGRRYYRPSDMALIGGIKRLLHDDGMTIRGVQKLLREQGVRHVAGLSQPLFEEEETGEIIDMPALRPEAAAPEAAPAPELETAEAEDAAAAEPEETAAEVVAEAEEAEVAADDHPPEAAAELEGEPGLLGLMNAPAEEHAPDGADAPALPDTAPSEPADLAEAAEPAVEDAPVPDAPLETVPEPVPAPPVIPETPDVPETDPADDAPEFDDAPALAARLARLSSAQLGGHSPALLAAHERLAALRQRIGG